MNTLTTILSILFLSAVSPVVADEVNNTPLNSGELSDLSLSLKSDFNTAQIQIGFDIEDEIANLERINLVSRTYLKREYLNHVQRLGTNSTAFPQRTIRIITGE